MTEYARFAKKYLREIWVINRELERKRAEREHIFNLAQQCGAVISGDRVQTSPRGDKTDDYIIQLVEIEQQCAELVKMWIAKREEIIDQIDELPDIRHRNVLYYRYVRGFRMDDVAQAMNYSIEMVKILHRNALDEFGRNYCESIAS